MNFNKLFILILINLLYTAGFSQTDTARRSEPPPRPPERPRNGEFRAQRAVLFRFNYTMCTPQADLAKRFGAFSSVGGSVGLKFEKGWDLRAEGSFLYGRNVNEYSVFDSIRNGDGYLVDKDGFNFNPQISMRGFTVGAHIGRLFPINENRNSGVFISVGGGFIQHRLHFQSISNFAPQLAGDYKKGYDRLTNGYYTNEFIGYQFMGRKKMVNFYIGLEFTQGHTQYARNWQYDLQGPDNHTRTDNYWGLRIGWILPIYRANRDEDEFIFR